MKRQSPVVQGQNRVSLMGRWEGWEGFSRRGMSIPFPAVSAAYTPMALSCGISFLGAILAVPSKQWIFRKEYQRVVCSRVCGGDG